jgi:hypothetical protein
LKPLALFSEAELLEIDKATTATIFAPVLPLDIFQQKLGI